MQHPILHALPGGADSRTRQDIEDQAVAVAWRHVLDGCLRGLEEPGLSSRHRCELLEAAVAAAGVAGVSVPQLRTVPS